MDAIVTQGLTKVYKALGKARIHALDNLTISIREGEVFGFLGRNGAGKTTTIKILCSLLKPSAGEAFVFGENVRTRASRRLFGYLPEQPYFYEYLTPKETLDFYGRLQGMSAGERAREWDRLSELLDLREIANRRIKGFSKGMRQRIGFAVALVNDPPLLILDEPMSGLDPLGRRQIRELILRCRDEGKTLFFSSHVLGDVEQICDRVSMLARGRLIKQGRIDELTGTHLEEVEVVFANLSAELETTLAVETTRHRQVDELRFFVFPTPDAANDAVRRVQAAGGTLVEFTPLKQSLEDYFLQEQEQAEAQA
jgi:ABC-2 type transport system ATP-binding protein